VAVYVDEAKYRFRRMVMCHMLADTSAELHEMADRIGIARKWFQRDASAPHYDICKSKRALAVSTGAVEVTERREFAAIIKRGREGWPVVAGYWI
jgi:uncharacterized protein DUF4031